MKIIRLDNFENLLRSIDTETQPLALLSGGTDIMPKVNSDRFDKEIIYDLDPFKKTLTYIRLTDDVIEIGAMTTFSEIAGNSLVAEHLPQLVTAINSIGSKQIRNMGTMAGNIANASPISDTSPVLLTKGAVVNAVSVNGRREISIDNFFVDFKKTSLQKNEIIESISVPVNKTRGKYGFYKIAVRPEMAMSKVNLAYAIEDKKIKLASGGATKMPVRLLNVEKEWGKELLSEELEKILEMDITPITDIRSTKEYRKKVLTNLIAELFQSFLV